MEEIYARIIEGIKENRSMVLATIIELVGSGPRGAGTKFLIMEDGSFIGTIGGGLLEAEVLKGAGKVFADRLPHHIHFTLTGKDVAKTDMLCGGDAEIFLEPLSAQDSEGVKIFKRVLEIERRGGSGLLVTVVDIDRWEKGNIPKLFLEPDGRRIGALPGLEGVERKLAADMPELIKKRQPGLMVYADDGSRVEMFVEPVLSDPVLCVFGAGHVSSRIVPLASLVGFKVVVIDDRPDFADPQKFPEAAEVHVLPFEGALLKLPVGEASYLVIVTRGHIHDMTVLAQGLRTDANYIGMIGSRRKIRIIFEKLLEQGFTQRDLDRVHAPIGLEIGAETPEEIAVSIVAELIKVRAGIEMDFELKEDADG
jgi:xanthine dehydrogenase accessory factor